MTVRALAVPSYRSPHPNKFSTVENLSSGFNAKAFQDQQCRSFWSRHYILVAMEENQGQTWHEGG